MVTRVTRGIGRTRTHTAWEPAVSAGAGMMYPLEDQFNGERGSRLRATFGQQCLISQHIEDVRAEEMARRAAAIFSQQRPKAPGRTWPMATHRSW